ncbi:hypothetical protein M3P21_00465 [Ruegeria sp. 2012CJ41-6]|uniref:Uncharacterized protein n=1 Tax=Ruegeria spongiae TaxID=2942209 RepID=A0ABT0PWL1_9RHOB|nr:hypothetical protein [Ruegeria spongiae]MCL6281990.1 hypothetical protein [Ruegeria spongiae]
MTHVACGSRSIEKKKQHPAFGKSGFVFLLASSFADLFSKMASNPFLVFSLRTDVVREAEVLARRLTWLSTLALDYASGVGNMETGLMERVLSELVRFEIAASDLARHRWADPQRRRRTAKSVLLT